MLARRGACAAARSGAALLGARVAALPGTLKTNYTYNSNSFAWNVATGVDGTTYATWWDGEGKPFVGSLGPADTAWTTFDLSTVAGNPLVSPVLNDGHNVIVVHAAQDGRVFVAANMHGHPLRMVSSTDFAIWGTLALPDSVDVTYPQFVAYPDDTLQFWWREGDSNSGALYFSTYSGGTWTAKTKVLDGTSAASPAPVGGPYPQRIVADRDGILHLFWTWRTGSVGAQDNHDIFYARSTNKGVTWTTVSGSALTLPMTRNTTTTLAYDTPGNNGLVNQNGADVDSTGKPHTAFFQNSAVGYTQIMHLWWTGSAWSIEVAATFDITVLVNISEIESVVSRPSVVCSNDGQTFILYQAATFGRALRAVDVTVPGSPVDFEIAAVDTGVSEFTFDALAARDADMLRILVTRNKYSSVSWVPQKGSLVQLPLSGLTTADLPVSAADLGSTPPAAPVLTISSASPSSVVVTWPAVSGAAGYEVQGTDSTYSSQMTDVGNVLTYTFTDPRTTDLRVRAYNAARDFSDWATADVASLTTYAAEVMADAPLAFWRTQESYGTGRVMEDSSGNGRHGSYDANPVHQVSGVAYGSGFNVNASAPPTYAATVPNAAWMNFTPHMTVEAWVKSTYAGTEGAIIARDFLTGSRHWNLRIVSGKASFLAFIGTSTTTGEALSTTSVNDGNWHHIVGTFDGSNVRVYVDGTLEATTALTGSLRVNTGTSPITLGYRRAATAVLYPDPTAISNVALYSTALSGARIAAHHAAAA